MTFRSSLDLTDRDVAIREIRAALKRRTGMSWSVRGGRGTGWGWITISSPPRRHVDGAMTEADRATLAEALDLDRRVENTRSVSVPDTAEYRREYVARARGETPPVYGVSYWE